MTGKTLLMQMVFLVAALPAFAQQHPNISGTWKLNVAKSNFGAVPPVNSEVEVIQQKEPTISEQVVDVAPDSKDQYTLTFNADGKEKTIPEGSPDAHLGSITLHTITAWWENKALIITMNFRAPTPFQVTVDVSSKDTVTLSDDGKVMTVSSHVSTNLGDFDMKKIYEKQS